MKARDIMVSPVITVKPHDSVKDVALLFLKRGISGAPVVDARGAIVGIISEGDLIYRSEIGTVRPHPYWFIQLAGKEILAADYVKACSRTVSDVMTRNVITAFPDATLNEIASTLEKNSIKRVPIIENGQVVGIVSRSNLVQAIASAKTDSEPTASDVTIRASLFSHLDRQPWSDTANLNAIIRDGIVELWGSVGSDAEKRATRIATESISGVRGVIDHLLVKPPKTAEVAERDISVR
jgi:CBS domain-containing protein